MYFEIAAKAIPALSAFVVNGAARVAKTGEVVSLNGKGRPKHGALK
jgi:hypothetical protein